MSTSTIIWIVVAVVVVLVVVAVLAKVMSGKSKDRKRAKAQDLRREAAGHATTVREREADARTTEAEALRSRAEAERRMAEAQRLEAEAAERNSSLSSDREELDDKLRKADKLDPDVNTKSDEYDPNHPTSPRSAFASELDSDSDSGSHRA